MLILATWLPVSNGRMYQAAAKVDRSPAQTIATNGFYLCAGTIRQIGHYN